MSDDQAAIDEAARLAAAREAARERPPPPIDVQVQVQPVPGGAGAAAAAAAPAVPATNQNATHNGSYSYNKGLTSKITIPQFDPADKKISARAWIAYVDLARTSAGTYKDSQGVEHPVWSSKQTCTNALMLLQGTANKWGIQILETQKPELSDWEKFKKSFKERFIPSLTLNEKMTLRDLKMTSIESVRDFFDRCTNNINLFYEDEWETLVKNEVNQESTPWEAPKQLVTQTIITRSLIFLDKTKDIEIRLAFASGLKEAIKRQVLFQSSNTVDEILKIAQRIEAGLKELKKSDIAILDVDSDQELVDVGAVNFRKKKKGQFQARSSSSSSSRSSGNLNGGFGAKSSNGPLKCFYCLKTGHFKDKCMTMKNDRRKGIYKSNIHSSPRVKANSVEADDSDSEDGSPSVNNCQTDLDSIAKMLNLRSV